MMYKENGLYVQSLYICTWLYCHLFQVWIQVLVEQSPPLEVEDEGVGALPWIRPQWTLIHLPPRYLIHQFSQEWQWLLTYQVFQDHCLPHLGLSIIRPHTFPTKAPCKVNLRTTFLRTPMLFTMCTPLPNPLTLTQTSPKRTLEVVKVKHNPVMGALEQRLGLSQMVTGKSSFVISYEVLHEFCITSNEFYV